MNKINNIYILYNIFLKNNIKATTNIPKIKENKSISFNFFGMNRILSISRK
jgi:hypothetical protein